MQMTKHSHGATAPYNGTGNQTQIAKKRSTLDANPSMLCQCCRTHGQTTVRQKINYADNAEIPQT